MDVAEFVGNAIGLVIGAYIIYVLINALVEIEPGFSQYATMLFGAFIAGAVLYLRYALSNR